MFSIINFILFGLFNPLARILISSVGLESLRTSFNSLPCPPPQSLFLNQLLSPSARTRRTRCARKSTKNSPSISSINSFQSLTNKLFEFVWPRDCFHNRLEGRIPSTDTRKTKPRWRTTVWGLLWCSENNWHFQVVCCHVVFLWKCQMPGMHFLLSGWRPLLLLLLGPLSNLWTRWRCSIGQVAGAEHHKTDIGKWNKKKYGQRVTGQMNRPEVFLLLRPSSIAQKCNKLNKRKHQQKHIKIRGGGDSVSFSLATIDTARCLYSHLVVVRRQCLKPELRPRSATASARRWDWILCNK